MNLDRKNVILLLGVVAALMILMMIALTAVSCSGKAKPADESDLSAAGGDTGVTAQEQYSPVKESIFETIRDSYSGNGIEITAIELAEGSGDSARITLTYLEHSIEQTTLAGLRILYENFPKLSNYVAHTDGVKHECSWRELAYLGSKGLNLDCTEEDAEEFMKVVVSGIPAEDEDMSIRSEAV